MTGSPGIRSLPLSDPTLPQRRTRKVVDPASLLVRYVYWCLLQPCRRAADRTPLTVVRIVT